MLSILVTAPERDSVKRNKGCLSACGEIIKRPLGSMVMQIQEPSPTSAECTNSTLKPGKTVSDSAGVAWGAFNTSPQGWSPSFPRLTALVQAASLKSRSRQPCSSLSELSQVVSVITKSLCCLLSLSWSTATTP